MNTLKLNNIIKYFVNYQLKIIVKEIFGYSEKMSFNIRFTVTKGLNGLDRDIFHRAYKFLFKENMITYKK